MPKRVNTDYLEVSCLNNASFPEFANRILQYDLKEDSNTPRTYPGYPTISLPKNRLHRSSSLERALRKRESRRQMSNDPVSLKSLSRLLYSAHGTQRSGGKGPVPSAGDLQALELYIVQFSDRPFPAGYYHYDRSSHLLSQIQPNASYLQWGKIVPSLNHVEGGAFLFVLVGDYRRVYEKYGERGARFLYLEAGHLQQNILLLSTTLKLAAVPLGAFFEREIAEELQLLDEDLVLSLCICGTSSQRI